MERPAKERLIGAAVLVALAIVLVPEMLSGPKSTQQKTPSSSGDAPVADMAPAGAVKTYSVDLNEAATPVAEEPAPPQPSESEPVAEPEAGAANQVASSGAVPDTAQKAATKPVETKSAVEKPTEKIPAANSPPPAKKASSGRESWIVQVGSFSAQAKAESLAHELGKQGFKASVTPATVGGKTLYRVRVGSGAERSAAEAMLAKLKATQPGASVVRE